MRWPAQPSQVLLVPPSLQLAAMLPELPVPLLGLE